jgi:hypothetical protein
MNRAFTSDRPHSDKQPNETLTAGCKEAFGGYNKDDAPSERIRSTKLNEPARRQILVLVNSSSFVSFRGSLLLVSNFSYLRKREMGVDAHRERAY